MHEVGFEPTKPKHRCLRPTPLTTRESMRLFLQVVSCYSLRGSNPRLSAHKTNTLPTELREFNTLCRIWTCFHLLSRYNDIKWCPPIQAIPFHLWGTLCVRILFRTVQSKSFQRFFGCFPYWFKYFIYFFLMTSNTIHSLLARQRWIIITSALPVLSG